VSGVAPPTHVSPVDPLLHGRELSAVQPKPVDAVSQQYSVVPSAWTTPTLHTRVESVSAGVAALVHEYPVPVVQLTQDAGWQESPVVGVPSVQQYPRVPPGIASPTLHTVDEVSGRAPPLQLYPCAPAEHANAVSGAQPKLPVMLGPQQ
jgi:hypothetical protein